MWGQSNAVFFFVVVVLLLVTKYRENPIVGAKNPGHRSHSADDHPIQWILSGRLSVREKSVAKSSGGC